MRLIVLALGHGKTQKNRLRVSKRGSTVGGANRRHSGIAHGTSRSATCFGANDLEGCCQGNRRGTGDGGSTPDPVSTPQRERSSDSQAVGRPTAGTDDTGRGASLFGCLETHGGAGSTGGGDTAAGGTGTETGAPGQIFGGVSPAGATRLAQSRPRHQAPQGRAEGAGGMEKKRFPKSWRPC